MDIGVAGVEEYKRDTVFIDDKDVLRHMARSDPHELRHVESPLLDNASFMKELVQINWESILYVGPSLRDSIGLCNNKGIALAGIAKSVGTIEAISSQLLSDPEVILPAVRQDWRALNVVGVNRWPDLIEAVLQERVEAAKEGHAAPEPKMYAGWGERVSHQRSAVQSEGIRQ